MKICKFDLYDVNYLKMDDYRDKLINGPTIAHISHTADYNETRAGIIGVKLSWRMENGKARGKITGSDGTVYFDQAFPAKYLHESLANMHLEFATQLADLAKKLLPEDDNKKLTMGEMANLQKNRKS